MFFILTSKAKLVLKHNESFTLLETLVALAVAGTLVTALITFALFSHQIKENAIIKMKQKQALLKAFSVQRHNEIFPSNQNGVSIIPDLTDKAPNDNNKDYINWIIVPEEAKTFGVLIKLQKAKSPAL